MKRGKTPMLMTLLVLLAASLFVADLMVGSVSLSASEVLRSLLGLEGGQAAVIVRSLRLPRSLCALISGSALAAAGLIMQAFFQNPLAGPYVLGLSSGASLGVALAVLGVPAAAGVFSVGGSFIDSLGPAAGAWIGSAAVFFLILLFSRRLTSPSGLLVVGLLVGQAVGAAVSLLIHFADPRRLRSYLSWSFGSFSAATTGQLISHAPFLVLGFVLALGLIKPLNAVLLGSDYGTTMGLNLKRFRFSAVLSTALLTGSVTALCGPVAFIGVAVPHLIRGLFGTSDHGVLMPASIFAGGALALAADLISRITGPGSALPVNAVTAFLGAPVILFAVLRTRGRAL